MRATLIPEAEVIEVKGLNLIGGYILLNKYISCFSKSLQGLDFFKYNIDNFNQNLHEFTIKNYGQIHYQNLASRATSKNELSLLNIILEKNHRYCGKGMLMVMRITPYSHLLLLPPKYVNKT